MTVTTRLKRAARVILVGAPGVGKGTQAERLMKRFPEISALSSGDLLRNNVRNRTPLGLEVEGHLSTGSLVPDNTILRLILSELEAKQWVVPKSASNPTPSSSMASSASPPVETRAAAASEDPAASFILDGFPRTAPQAELLAPHLPINLAVALVTPASIIIDRIGKRWVHAPSGRVYNTEFNPPKTPGKDDVTGEALSKRPDDEEGVWRKRLQKFQETSEPLLEFYERKGVLWTVQGNSSNEISPQLFAEFERRFG